MGRKVLIVGGVAGGASAAARLRRLDEDAHIVMFERDPYISFANCGLPYYIGGSIQDRSKLLVQTPEAMERRFNIDVRIQSEVVSIDPVNKKVRVQSKERGSYEESYDALILSPGAKPVRHPLPGIESSKIHTLRNIPDTDKVKARVEAEGTRSAVVIGGGFIGVEMAENLKEAGLDVTLIEAGPQILAPFDPEMASVLAKELEDHGVKLMFSERVEGFEDAGEQIKVQLASGTVLLSEMVLLAIGVSPDTAFLKESGLAIGPRSHILVNERMETNLEHVYAVGDAVEVTDFVNGHIDGSVNIPVDELRARLGELDPSKDIWVYCQVGLRGYTASRILKQKGFRVRNLTGGYKTYLMGRYTPQGRSNPQSGASAAARETAAAAAAPAGTPTQAPAPAAPDRILEPDATLDACGLCCPGPLIQVKQNIDQLQEGQILKVTASDPGFYEDIKAWAQMSRNRLMRLTKLPGGTIEAYLCKGGTDDTVSAPPQPVHAHSASTMVVFSGDLDKAIASFIIANGAAESWLCPG